MADDPESQPFIVGEHSTNSRHSQQSCRHVLQTEFRTRNLGFDFTTDVVFVRSQWPCCPNILFVIYRLVVAIYSTTITMFSIVRFDHDIWRLPWPVWLTNWSYFLLTCHLLCAAVIACLNCMCRRPPHLSPTVLPYHVRFNWLLFSVATPAAFIVTVVYFSAVFPTRHRNYLSVEDINLHLLNSVLVLLELALSGFPVRLLHVVYVWLYGLLYVAFSAVYWAIDHTNVMYPGVLDWNKPRTTAIVLVSLTIVGIPLLQFVTFAIYRLRLAVYQNCLRYL